MSNIFPTKMENGADWDTIESCPDSYENDLASYSGLGPNVAEATGSIVQKIIDVIDKVRKKE